MSFARDHSTTNRSLASRVASGPVSFIAPFSASDGAGLARERCSNTRARVQDMGCRSHRCLDLSLEEISTSSLDP